MTIDEIRIQRENSRKEITKNMIEYLENSLDIYDEYILLNKIQKLIIEENELKHKHQLKTNNELIKFAKGIGKSFS